MATSTKTAMMLREEQRLGRSLEEIIPETYERVHSVEATAAELGIKPNTLYIWMLRLGMTRRVTLVAPGLTAAPQSPQSQ